MARRGITPEEIEAEAATAGEQPPRIEPTQPKLSITRSDRMGAQPAPQVEIPPEASETHPCGLPMYFIAERSKSRIVRYVKQYEFTNADRQGLEITPIERELFQVYRREVGPLAVSIDFYVAALRMWRTGEFPIVKRPRLDLRKFKVLDKE